MATETFRTVKVFHQFIIVHESEYERAEDGEYSIEFNLETLRDRVVTRTYEEIGRVLDVHDAILCFDAEQNAMDNILSQIKADEAAYRAQRFIVVDSCMVRRTVGHCESVRVW